MGADVVPGFERDRAHALGMVFRADWAEEVLHDVRGDLHGEFVFVRAGAEPGRTGDFPDFAGRWWRRVAAKRAGHSERYISAGETRHGICRVCTRGGRGADDWTVAGRLDHGQFFVEMDFLHQCAG